MEIKCKKCGALLVSKDGQEDVKCPHCGTLHNVDDIYYGSLINKGYSLLSKGDYENAQSAFQEASGVVALSGDAYLGVLLSEYKVDSLDQLLETASNDITSEYMYQKAKNKANQNLIKELIAFEEKLQGNNILKKYMKAKKALEAKRSFEAIALFKELGDYRDSKELLKECQYELAIVYFDIITNPTTEDRIAQCDKAKKAFEVCNGYKDSKDYLKRIETEREKILHGIKSTYLNSLVIKYLKTASSVSELAKVVNTAKEKQKLTFEIEFDEVKEKQAGLMDEVRKFFLEVCPALIGKLDTINNLNELEKLCKEIEKDNCFESLYPSIEERRKELLAAKVSKKKKTKKIILFASIAAASVAIISIVLGITLPIAIKSGNYSHANHAMEIGNYDQAIYYYKKIGEEKSNNKISVCNGLKLLDDTKNSSMNDSLRTALLRQGIEKVIDGKETVQVYYDADSSIVPSSRIKNPSYKNTGSGSKEETINNKNFEFYVPIKTGANFISWYTKDVYYQDGQSHLSLFALWDDGKTIIINYELNGGTNNPNNPTYYAGDSTITLLDPSREGYTFEGWYDSNGNRVYALSIDQGDYNIEARWSANKYQLSVTSNNNSMGKVYIRYGSGYTDENITIEAVPNSGYDFDGWYDGSNLINRNEKFSFKMPPHDYTLEGRFASNSSSGSSNGSSSSSEAHPNSHTHNFVLAQNPYIDERTGCVSLTRYYCSNCNDVAYRWSAMEYDESLSNDIDIYSNYIRFRVVENANGTVQRGTHIIYKFYLGSAISNAQLSFNISPNVQVPIFSTEGCNNEVSTGYIKQKDGTLKLATSRYGLIVNNVEYELGPDPYESSGNQEGWYDWPVSFSLTAGENIIDIYALGTYRARMFEYQIIQHN